MDNTTLDPVSLEESKDTAVLCPDQRFKIDKHGKVKVKFVAKFTCEALEGNCILTCHSNILRSTRED